MTDRAVELSAAVQAEAERLGFALVGVVEPHPSDHMDLYREWLDRGHHGEMAYLAREDAVARRADPTRTLASVRSIIVVADEYASPAEEARPSEGDRVSGAERERLASGPGDAIIARYARGDDYHDVMASKLQALLDFVRRQGGPQVEGRIYVDTGPLLERELARRAGLGWFGKNTMLIHPDRGSWFLLGTILLDLALAPTEPFTEDRCGSCSACLEGCPTGALLGRDSQGAPVIDARRCISYLTIEQKGAIPLEFRAAMGNRVFGCDICQEVCPWNQRFAQEATEQRYKPRAELDDPGLVTLAERLLGMSGKGFMREFAGSPLQRAGRKGLLRNVCVALGNSGSQDAVSVLTRALEDPSELVREHAAWALESIGSGSTPGS